jgi:RNA polymerase sigma factor (sigma-70 family)
MDNTAVSTQCQFESQDALITEISRLAREFARQFARRGQWEDLAQDVVLECLEQIRAGDWPADVVSLPAYINRIVSCRAANRARDDRTAADGNKMYVADVVASERAWMLPSVQQEERDVLAAVHEVRAHMSIRCYVVYVGIRELMMTIKEAAEKFDMSERAVASHLRRAERAIRAELLACGLMPEGTTATRRMLRDAQARVPAVRARRAYERKRRAEHEAAALDYRKEIATTATDDRRAMPAVTI